MTATLVDWLLLSVDQRLVSSQPTGYQLQLQLSSPPVPLRPKLEHRLLPRWPELFSTPRCPPNCAHGKLTITEAASNPMRRCSLPMATTWQATMVDTKKDSYSVFHYTSLQFSSHMLACLIQCISNWQIGRFLKQTNRTNFS